MASLEPLLGQVSSMRNAASDEDYSAYSDRADTLLDRLRRRAMESSLSDTDMEWFQQDQARARAEREAREAQRGVTADQYIREIAKAMRAPQSAPQDAPYGQTYPEIETPQDLVRARVNQLASMPPSPEAARYAAGRQQVANQPLSNVDARMLRDAAIRASAMVNPMDVASMFTEAPLPGSSARLLESLQAKETAKMTPEQLGRRSAQDDVLNADRKSTRLNSSHIPLSRMPSSA